MVAGGAINAEAEGQLDGLVELGLREFGKNFHRFSEWVILGENSDLEGAAVAFALFFWHCDSLRCERP